MINQMCPGHLSKDEARQYCFQLLGVDNAELLDRAMHDVFGEFDRLSSHALDQMKDMIGDTYQRY